MQNEQLVKAFQLMKEGEKGQAGVIVKGILRDDPKNLNAWWLMSHIFEDDDKVVKSLEKVLEINPNHTAARRRLAQLRPEYGNLVSDDAKVAKQIKKDAAKADKDYWKKLERGPRPQKPSFNILSLFANRLGIRLALVLIFGVCAIPYTLFYNTQSEERLPDINGNTPEYAVETFFYASATHDADTLYAITCPELHDRVDWIVSDFDEYIASETVDFSKTVFHLEHHDVFNNRAYVTVSGETIYTGGGYTTSYDWREAARIDGYDFFAEFVHKIDGQWVICTEYDVPNVDHENDPEY